MNSSPERGGGSRRLTEGLRRPSTMFHMVPLPDPGRIL